MKILMVCLGNICRSPLAHGILEHKAKLNSLDISVDSAGTGTWHIGNKPDERSIEIAKKNGISIHDQRARQVSFQDLKEFDLIFAMDTTNYADIKSLDPNGKYHHKVKLILNEIEGAKDKNVPDPYFGGKEGFKTVFKLLDHACDELINKIKIG